MEGMAAVWDVSSWTVESIHTCSHRYALLVRECMTLCDAMFYLHYRSVARADRKPMQSEYDEYKVYAHV